MSYNRPNTNNRSYLIGLWFFIDAVVALAPPLYWMANDYRMVSILGLPTSLFYFLAVAVCVTASLIVAYRVEAARGEFDQ